MHLLNPTRLSRCPTKLVNGAFTTFDTGLEPEPRVCHGRVMAKPSPMAGGFFWMAAILIGAVWGVAAGNPMKGVLLGTGVGGLTALAVWLVDRSRRRT
jgi:hypothetical protein